MTRVNWQDEIVEKPRTFNKIENPDGTVTLEPAKGEIYQEGTPVNAANLNALGVELDEHQADETSHGIGNKTTLQTNHKSTIVGAMNELFTNVSDGKQLIGGAITDVDENVVIPTEPTFQQLAGAIGQISTGKKWASGTFNYILYSGNKVTLPFDVGFLYISYTYNYTYSVTHLYSSKEQYRPHLGGERVNLRIHDTGSMKHINKDSDSFLSVDGNVFNLKQGESEGNITGGVWIAFE